MFKKKAKNTQGILSLDGLPAINSSKASDKLNQLSGIVPNIEQSTNVFSDGKDQSRNIPVEAYQQLKRSEKDREGLNEGLENKRSLNYEFCSGKGILQYGQEEPQKMIKQGRSGVRVKGRLGGNTREGQEARKAQVHREFRDMNYQAGKNLIKDLGLNQDELEEEVAKRLFLQNVEATKKIKQGKADPKIYRGLNAYANHRMGPDDLEKAEENYKKKAGPSRVNSTIRNTCRFDYVLNLCKDWHVSGYCPFGNSCLYLHDRSVVKTGWELEKEFEQAERERWRRIANPEVAKKEARDASLLSIEQYKPVQICPACKEKFRKAVQVQCGHIFCTHCALKISKCSQCGKRLGGIMNSAEDKLAKQAAIYEEMKAKLEKQDQDQIAKRRRYQNVDNLQVFNE